MKTNMLRALLGGLCALALTIQPAKAITYTLGVGNPAIAGYPGPYATVNVTLVDSTHATITFAALTSGTSYQYLFGDGSSAALSVNAGSFSAGAISFTQLSGFNSPAPFSVNYGLQQVDGFGRFNFTIDSQDGYASGSTGLTFTLTDLSGNWANASDVLDLNDGGSHAAAHIFAANYPATKNGGALATGYAADGQQVPDGGSTVALLGCGLAGIGMISRKFRKS